MRRDLNSGLGSVVNYLCDPGRYLTFLGLNFLEWEDHTCLLTSHSLCEIQVTSYNRRSWTSGTHHSRAKRREGKEKLGESLVMPE